MTAAAARQATERGIKNQQDIRLERALDYVREAADRGDYYAYLPSGLSSEDVADALELLGFRVSGSGVTGRRVSWEP